MEYAIGFIGTSQRLLDSISEVAGRMGRTVCLREDGLDHAVKTATQMVAEDGVEVILSLRGTAKILQRHLDVPILSMPDSTKNRIIAIKAASYISKSIFLPMYVGETYDVSFLESLLGINIHYGYYTDISTLESIILKAGNKGFGCVVGGGMAVSISKKHNIPCYLVLPTVEDIEVGIDNAFNIAKTTQNERNTLATQRIILDSISDGIIAIDSMCNITEINKNAKSIFNISSNVIGTHVDDIIKGISISKTVKNNAPSYDDVKDISGNQYIVNNIPIVSKNAVIGGICTLQAVSKAMKTAKVAHKSITKGHVSKYTLDDYIYRSHLMAEVMEKVRYFAECDSTVLLTGQTGTGKEILAHGIHHASRRSKGPFVSVNCSALPEQLLESELFGYEGGSFTGSKRDGKIGLFELAENGTLFLDEINSMSSNLQALLLRVLQEKELRRVGGDALISVNVRIVTATNRPLALEVQDGRMREDLFFRLNVLTIEVPPLYKRPEDIPLLVASFIHKTAARNGLEPFILPQVCLDRLCVLPWSGNARELEFFVERLVILSRNGFNQKVFDDLYAEISSCAYQRGKDVPQAETVSSALYTPDREQILQALQRTGYRKGRAAVLLGVSRTTMWRMMRQLGIPSRPGVAFETK